MITKTELKTYYKAADIKAAARQKSKSYSEYLSKSEDLSERLDSLKPTLEKMHPGAEITNLEVNGPFFDTVYYGINHDFVNFSTIPLTELLNKHYE